jgi:hypothetical protein
VTLVGASYLSAVLWNILYIYQSKYDLISFSEVSVCTMLNEDVSAYTLDIISLMYLVVTFMADLISKVVDLSLNLVIPSLTNSAAISMMHTSI